MTEEHSRPTDGYVNFIIENPSVHSKAGFNPGSQVNPNQKKKPQLLIKPQIAVKPASVSACTETTQPLYEIPQAPQADPTEYLDMNVAPPSPTVVPSNQRVNTKQELEKRKSTDSDMSDYEPVENIILPVVQTSPVRPEFHEGRTSPPLSPVLPIHKTSTTTYSKERAPWWGWTLIFIGIILIVLVIIAVALLGVIYTGGTGATEGIGATEATGPTGASGRTASTGGTGVTGAGFPGFPEAHPATLPTWQGPQDQ